MEYHLPLNVADLARRVSSSKCQLQRAFSRELGISAHDYHRLTRIISALEHILACDKIEAVALQVGYRSKKNFYRAFHHLTGLTPTQFRAVPGERAMQLIERLRSEHGRL
jgi:transcriptional regulator GlxA family with amidase domain